MRGFIPLKVQYIFMFIPFLNSLVLFATVYNLTRVPWTFKLNMQFLAALFASTLITAVPYMALDMFFGKCLFTDILYWVMLYVMPLVMALGLIKFQKKVLGL